jgi:hypothetical protein
VEEAGGEQTCFLHAPRSGGDQLAPVRKDCLWLPRSCAPDSERLPAGLLSHVAGSSGGKLIVVEVWESQAAQEEFMHSELGPALAQAKAPDPTRVEWFSSVADVHNPLS